MPTRVELTKEIEKVEAHLARLQTEEGQSRARLAALRAELAALSGAETRTQVRLPATIQTPTPRTPEEKIRLFRGLFRGRGDILPTRFVSKKTGRHELSMDSYDRLFPSQDTMPRGGFGNLIALPSSTGPGSRETRCSSTISSSPCRAMRSGATWRGSPCLLPR